MLKQVQHDIKKQYNKIRLPRWFSKIASLTLALTLLAVIISSTIHIARGASFTSYQTGNWSDQCTWAAACNTGVPASGDSVTISAGHTVTITNGNPVNIGAGAITNNGTLILNDNLTSGDLSNVGGSSALTTNDKTVAVASLTNSGTITAGASAISVSGNYINSGTFTAGTSTITMTATTIGKTFTAGTSQTYNNVTFNGVGGGWTLQDDLTTTSTATVSLANGSFLTNNHNIDCGAFMSSVATTRTINVGSSTITTRSVNGGYAFNVNSAGLTYDFVNSTVISTTSGAAIISFGSGGSSMSLGTVTFQNGAGTKQVWCYSTLSSINILNFVGGTTQTGSLTFNSSLNINTVLNIAGNSAINRTLVQSSVIGTPRIITLGASATMASVSNYVDFQDITVTGGAINERDFQTNGKSTGDCGGNSGITFTTASLQTWNGTTGNWSTTGFWTSRIPLPQDNVIIPDPGATSRTLTADMPRLGKDITVTNANATNKPTLRLTNQSNTMYGSLTLVTSTYMTFTNNTITLTFAGRANSSLTSSGQTFTGSVTVLKPLTGSDTLTLVDAFVNTGSNMLSVSDGTLTTNSNVTTYRLNTSTGAVVNMGSGTWSVYGATTCWLTADGTINAQTSTINITDTTADHFFQGRANTYNNITIVPSSFSTIFSGAFTFANMTMASAGTKTVKFTKNTTYTMTGTNFLSGTSNGLLTISSDTSGTPATLSKTSGIVDMNWTSVQDMTGVGGATWNAHFSTSVSGNTNINFPTYKTVSNAGGNWDSNASWVQGSTPITTDDIGFTPTSGSLAVNVTSTCGYMYTGGFTNTITAGAVLTITNSLILNGGTFNSVSYNMNVGGNFARTSGTFTAGTGTITMNSTSISKTFIAGAQTYNNLTFDGVGGGWTLQDALTLTNAIGTLNLTNGTLNSNNQTLNIGNFVSSNSNLRTFTLGSSVITITGTGNGWATAPTTTNLTLNTNTSSIIFINVVTLYSTGQTFYDVTFQGGGSTLSTGSSSFHNITYTGTATKTNVFTINSTNSTLSGTLSINGNSSVNRVQVVASTLGTSYKFTNNGTNNISNTDFRDIQGAGTTNWDLKNIPGGSGDCGGNSGITFTQASNLYWYNSGAGTYNWSDVTHWYTATNGTGTQQARPPLPQDDVYFDVNSIHGATTITSDMPRAGKNIDWTGATNTPTWNMNSMDFVVYGSIKDITAMNITSGMTISFEGRGAFTLTSGEKTFNHIKINMIGGSLTLQDNLVFGRNIALNYGTFNASTYNITTNNFNGSNSNTRTLSMGSGIWTITSVSAEAVWILGITTGLTMSLTTATINIGNASTNNDQTFSGGGITYGNVSIYGGGTGKLTFIGANTFNNFTINAPKTVKFTNGTTTTINGTFSALGASGSLITLASSTSGSAATISKLSGSVDINWASIQDITATGGATFTAHYSTNVSGNTGINFPTYKTISDGGGNWDATGSWVQGIVPTSSDEVVSTATSGSLSVNVAATCASFNLSGYANTLSGSSSITVTGPAYIVPVTISGTITWTGTLTLTPASGGTINLTTNGKTLPNNTTFNGLGTVSLLDNLTVSSAMTLGISSAIFNTNNYNISCGGFNSSNAVTRTLNFGTSSITITANTGSFTVATSTGLTLNATSSSINLSNTNTIFNGGTSKSYGIINFNSDGTGVLGGTTLVTVNTLNVTGTASKTVGLSIGTNIVVNTALNLAGNSSINRLLVYSNGIGTARSITSNGTNTITNADFQDIIGAGTANWNLSSISGGSGDCGGNTGIIFTTAIPQTFTNVAGGNWSVASNWTSRVPLPQDNVTLNRGGNYNSGVTITADMPRLGKSIDATGMTWTGTATTLAFNNQNMTIYGSLILISTVTFSQNKSIIFGGRSNSSLVTAGKSIANAIEIDVVGATMTFQDAVTGTPWIELYHGTLTAMSNVSFTYVWVAAGTTLNMGNGTWTQTATTIPTWTAKGIINAGSSTIALSYSGASATSFENYNSAVYNNITIAPGSGILTFSGAFTFANMTMPSTGIKTVKFTNGTTYTMTGTNFLSGTGGNLVTIASSTSGTPATLSKTSGTIDMNWTSIQDITATGGATFNAHYSTNVSGNTGINFLTYKTVSNAGGNWDSTGSWVEGIIPATTDDIGFTATSGNLALNVTSTCANVDTSAYTNTIMAGAVLTVTNNFTLNGGTFNASTFNMNVGGNYSRISGTYTGGSGTITMTATTIGKTYVAGGQTYNNITFNGASGGWSLIDALSTSSTGTITLTQGTLHTDGPSDNSNLIHSWGIFTTQPGTKTLNLGNSRINVTGTLSAWTYVTTTATLNEGTSLITFTGPSAIFTGGADTYYDVIFNGGGNSRINNSSIFHNLTFTGTASQSNNVIINATSINVSGALSINGNSSINRILVYTASIGTCNTITLGGSATLRSNTSNADFMDIGMAGGVANERDLSAISGGSGDAGGNTGIIFTSAVSQTFTNAAGGNWSVLTNWTSRIPLPQDDVTLNRGGNYNSGVTITADMPRIGKNIDATGMTWTGTATTLAFTSQMNTLYGSFTLIPGITFTTANSKSLFMAGRTNSSLTSAGKTMLDIIMQKPGATLTFNDTVVMNGYLTLTQGSLVTTHDVTAYVVNLANTVNLDMGNGTWTIIGGTFGSISAWNNKSSGTLAGNNSTIIMTYAGVNTVTFEGGTNKVYNNILINPGVGVLIFKDAFTFANMSMSGAGAKTVKFTNGTTYTMTGTTFFSGTSTAPTVSTIISGSTLNGDFETAGGGGADVFGSWNEDSSGSSTVSATNTVGEFHGGTTGLKLITDSSNSMSRVYQNILTVGKYYKVTYWAKTNIGGSNIEVGDWSGGTIVQTLTTSWVQYSTNFYVSSGPTFVIKRSSANTISYIDDVVLQQYDGAMIGSSTNGSTFTLSKASGNVDADHIYLQDSTATGGATFNVHYGISGGNDTGWGFPAYKIVSNSGGNWDSTGSWVEGSVPLTTDEVGFTGSSGNLAVNVASTCSALNTSGYANTITAGAVLTITNNFNLNGGTFNAVSYNMNVGGNFTRTSGTFTAGTGTITMNSTSTGKTFTSGAQTYNNLTFDGVGGGWSLLDSLNTNSTGVVTLTNGILHTDGLSDNSGLSHSWGKFDSNNSNTRTLNLGASTITITGIGTSWYYVPTNSTLNEGTSIIILSGADTTFRGGADTYYDVRLNGSGTLTSYDSATFTNLTRVGTSTQTDGFILRMNQTVNGALTFVGNSTINRLLVKTDVIGLQRTITLGASATLKTNSSNVDFMDFRVTGGATNERDLKNIPGGSGDCGGNSGITFTQGSNLYWYSSGAGTYNWSDSTHWFSAINGTGTQQTRPPLPQDNITIPDPGGTGRTLIADMPRLGKDITVTNANATNKPTLLTNNQDNTVYGSFTLVSSTYLTFTTTKILAMAGRSDAFLDTAGQNLSSQYLDIYKPGAKLTLNSALVNPSTGLRLFNGDFDANDFNVASYSCSVAGYNASSNIWMGNGTWNVRDWYGNVSTNLYSEGSTISLRNDNTIFRTHDGNVFNNITLVPGATVTTFFGAFTFVNMTMASAGTKTIKFTNSTTYTMTGTNFLSGIGANLITLASSTSGSPATLSKSSGVVDVNWASIQDITATGGATWNAHYSTNVSGNSGWNFPGFKTVSNSGGNWDSTSSWVEGIVPTTSDDIGFTPTSGNLAVNVTSTCANLNTTGYTNTITQGAVLTVTNNFILAGGTFNSATYNMNVGGNYTRTSGTYTGGSGTITMTATTTGKTFIAGGQTYNNITFNGASGSWSLIDSLSTSSTGMVTLTQGSLHTDGVSDNSGLTHNWGKLDSNNSNTRILTLGASFINLSTNVAALNIPSGSGLTLNSGSSTLNFNNANNLSTYWGGKAWNNATFNIGGFSALDSLGTFNSLTFNGSATKSAASLVLYGNTTIYNSLTINGNSTINRAFVYSSTIGTPRVITVKGATLNISNADFQDISFANGGADVNLSAISGGSGDCGGNLMSGGGILTFTTAVPQTFTNATGGNWSVSTNWTSRVPLPQDNVSFNTVFGASKTVTADMPRLGKNVDWSGATYTTALTFAMNSVNNTVYGNLNLTGISSLSSAAYSVTFAGRNNTTLTSNGKSFGGLMSIVKPGATLNLNDNLILAASGFAYITVGNGTFTTNGFNVSAQVVQFSSGTIGNIQNSVITLFANSSNLVWQATGATINASGSTIFVSATNGTGTLDFKAANNTYNDIIFAPNSNINISTLSGNFTFHDMYMSAPGSRTIIFGSGNIITMTGTRFLDGNGNNLVTINSYTPGAPFTLTKSSGIVSSNYLSIQDSTATGGAEWFAGGNSTNVSGNDAKGWIFSDSVAQNRYWVSSTASNWNSSANWSNTSNGTGGYSIPTSVDNTIFDGVGGKSGGITLTSALDVGTLDLRSTYAGTLNQNSQTIHTGTALNIDNADLSPSASLSSSGTMLIGTNRTLSLAGQTLLVTGTLTSSGTLKLNGDENTSLTMSPNSGTVQYLAVSGTRDLKNWTYYNLTINGSGGTFTLPTDISVAGNLTISNGTLSDNGHNLSVGGNWSKTNGNFTGTTGTVTMNATSTGKTITTGGSSFASLVFNGVGGGWTLQDNLTCKNITLTNGLVTDSGKMVTVNGNISIANTAGLLTSTGTWVQGANGNIINPNNNYINIYQVSNNINITKTGVVYVRKIIMGVNSNLSGNFTIMMSPTANNCIDMASGSDITGGSLLIGTPNGSNYSQKAFSMTGNLKIMGNNNTFTATGNWSVGSIFITGSTGSISLATAQVVDMGIYNFTSTGEFRIGDTNVGYPGGYQTKIKLGSGTHSFGGNLYVTQGTGGTTGYIDFGSSTVSLGKNIDFTSTTVTPGASTINMTSTASGKTITSAGQSFNNLTFNGVNGGWGLSDDLDVNGDFKLQNGTLTTNSHNINVGRDWNRTGGVYTSGTTKVTLDSGQFGHVYGDTSFYDLELNTAGATTNTAKSVNFAANSTQTITHTLTLSGSANKPLTLGREGGTSLNHWNLTLPGNYTSGPYINVNSSNINVPYTITPDATTTDLGNNIGWNFPIAADRTTHILPGSNIRIKGDVQVK